jgi:hypothetical protein
VKKQRKLLGSGAITDGETYAKYASVDGPLGGSVITDGKTEPSAFLRITDGITDAKNANENSPSTQYG